MPENHPWKREKSKGSCSRVSTNRTGLGVFSCVPPRSASTGMDGGGTGMALISQVNGGAISVRRLLNGWLDPLLFSPPVLVLLLLRVPLQAQLNQPFNQLRILEPRCRPQLGIHADGSKSGHGVDFVQIDFPRLWIHQK